MRWVSSALRPRPRKILRSGASLNQGRFVVGCSIDMRATLCVMRQSLPLCFSHYALQSAPKWARKSPRMGRLQCVIIPAGDACADHNPGPKRLI
jgi:hypothetical protein